MLRITNLELTLLVVLCLGSGQIAALAYSHGLWSTTTSLVLAGTFILVALILRNARKRSEKASTISQH